MAVTSESRSIAVNDEQQVAALREEIRRADATARSIRLAICRGLMILAAAIALFTCVRAVIALQHLDGSKHSFQEHDAWAAAIATPGVCLVGFVFAAACATLVGRSVATLYRLHRTAQLTHCLAGFPAASRIEALRSLQGDPVEDTGVLACELLRTFKPASELLPAAIPTARGDEPTAAEETDGAPVDR